MACIRELEYSTKSTTPPPWTEDYIERREHNIKSAWYKATKKTRVAITFLCTTVSDESLIMHQLSPNSNK